MPPTLRLSVPVAHGNYELGRDDYETPSSGSDYDESSSASEDSEQSDHVRSPTRLVYNLDALPEKTKSTVRDAFNEPPSMVVQHCRQVDDTFAFQMSEVVTRSVRIRAPSSGEARLSCSCTQGTQEHDKEPCHHILWLLDQLVKQTLYDADHEKPLTMTSAGYPEEMGDPFHAISEHHLNIVADGLHCKHVDQGCYDPKEASKHRIQESRELLSSVYDTPTDSFRSDIFDEPLLSPPIVKPQDLDYTVFRMLVDDDLFFHYFLSESTRGSDVIQQFRLLTHRINAVLQDFDAHNSGASSDESNSPQGSHSVAWAARHIQGVISLVRYAIFSGERPLNATEKAAAARTLIHILDCVVKRCADARVGGRRAERNLFLRFLGDVDIGFILNELEMIPDGARPYLYALDLLVNKMAENEAKPSYLIKFRKFIAQLKMSGPAPSRKRASPSSEENEGSFKRMR
ncbi:SWIM zinc finger protein [Cordyceps javanica]|uniref:SWIM zinc finger protein n=1 Tax=Cordyceps javanica TaxID=43265 RepID=A0A545W3A3_9HYPO|nr:SWIM zinc finger protein [Cordyceps javanica]TQW08430.1 SWIM zinc finger protein [Cordyceps javanica]